MRAQHGHPPTVQRCAHHLQLWLAATDVTYGRASVEGFARAHPALFGQAYDLTLHGYERWRKRQSLEDSVENFARYLVPRHERWLATGPPCSTVAFCLIDGDRPCWKAAEVRPG